MIVSGIGALLMFAVGLLVGIVTLALVHFSGHSVNMAGAYRYFAFPAGVFGMIVTLGGMAVAEIRERRRTVTHPELR